MKTNPLNLRLKLAHEKKVKRIKRNQLNRRARSYNPKRSGYPLPLVVIKANLNR